MTSLATSRVDFRRIRLLVADDSPAFLEDVVQALEPHYEIVGALRSGAAVLRCPKRDTAEVMVLDISLGDMSGIEVARRLRELGYIGKIVFLTVHEEQEFVVAALAAGAQGYVVKSRLASDLMEAIVTALAGEIFISASLRDQVCLPRV